MITIEHIDNDFYSDLESYIKNVAEDLYDGNLQIEDEIISFSVRDKNFRCDANLPEAIIHNKIDKFVNKIL